MEERIRKVLKEKVDPSVLGGLRLDMEDALKVPVDLVTNDSSDHEFLNLIAKDEVLLYRKS